MIQTPAFPWIGCSDSGFRPTKIVGGCRGEVFVHRNVANQAVHTDLNCLSVIQFAVEALKVQHIMVVGHYGCGGSRRSTRRVSAFVDIWLRHSGCSDQTPGGDQRCPTTIVTTAFCELNTPEQRALNVCQTMVVQDAWRVARS